MEKESRDFREVFVMKRQNSNLKIHNLVALKRGFRFNKAVYKKKEGYGLGGYYQIYRYKDKYDKAVIFTNGLTDYLIISGSQNIRARIKNLNFSKKLKLKYNKYHYHFYNQAKKIAIWYKEKWYSEEKSLIISGYSRGAYIATLLNLFLNADITFNFAGGKASLPCKILKSKKIINIQNGQDPVFNFPKNLKHHGKNIHIKRRKIPFFLNKIIHHTIRSHEKGIDLLY
jgi:hypothetical protein